jgi:hypothetical protein
MMHTKEEIDYAPSFLSRTEADELLAFMDGKQELKYGPQIYPVAHKRDTSYTEPQGEPENAFISDLRNRMAARYGIPFNSVRLKRHAGSSEVRAHVDVYGVVPIIRVGATRLFEMGGGMFHNRPYFQYSMPHGSLLTMKKSLMHRMKPEPTAGDCISVIFRLVTEGQTTTAWYSDDKSIEGKARRLHKKTYNELCV